jgi:fructose-specific phosphotransferase system IIA component
VGTAGSEGSLSRLLKEKYINLALKENNKRKIIVELVDLIASSGKLKDKKSFINQILKREKLGSTGIGNGVAIPHAKSDKVKDFIMAFARHNQGLDFGALDGEKTYLFFILASPESNVGGHLKILADVSRLVKDKFIVERLKNAKDKKEILKIIEAYEK